MEAPDRAKVQPHHLAARPVARLQYPPPFLKDLDGLQTVEVLEGVTAVNEVDGVGGEHREAVDARPIIDVREVRQIDVDKPGNVPLAAAKVEL